MSPSAPYPCRRAKAEKIATGGHERKGEREREKWEKIDDTSGESAILSAGLCGLFFLCPRVFLAGKKGNDNDSATVETREKGENSINVVASFAKVLGDFFLFPLLLSHRRVSSALRDGTLADRDQTQKKKKKRRARED